MVDSTFGAAQYNRNITLIGGPQAYEDLLAENDGDYVLGELHRVFADSETQISAKKKRQRVEHLDADYKVTTFFHFHYSSRTGLTPRVRAITQCLPTGCRCIVF